MFEIRVTIQVLILSGSGRGVEEKETRAKEISFNIAEY